MPPIEQRENNTDHFFIPQEMQMLEQKEMLGVMNARDKATRAINDYTSFLCKQGIMGHMTIDDYINNCLALAPVRDYLHFADDHCNPTLDDGIKRCLEQHHTRNIRIHISLKIKEYIDGDLRARNAS
jgi:hypothetical protein